MGRRATGMGHLLIWRQTLMTNNQFENSHGRLPGAEERDFCLRLCREIGLSEASRKLGVSRVTLASAAAGLPVLAGSLELIRVRRMASEAGTAP
jgi:hypothetical protein